MPSPTLVIAEYPIGSASGFGETLYNLFDGLPDDGGRKAEWARGVIEGSERFARRV